MINPTSVQLAHLQIYSCTTTTAITNLTYYLKLILSNRPLELKCQMEHHFNLSRTDLKEIIA